MGDDPAGTPGRHRARPATLAIAVVALGWLAVRTHQIGHDWGDDFALYIRQARSIVEGFPHQVEPDNRFSLAASGWSTFSPPIYPWGWPLLMAPVVAVLGVDYAALKVLIVAFWCIALAAWFLVVRERTSPVRSWVLLAALGLSWPYIVWTNSVVSDIPYLGVAFVTLWWLDRCRLRRAWDGGPWWPLVALGLGMSLAFNIRRDGLAVSAAVVAAIAIQVMFTMRNEGRSGLTAHWRRWALPVASFVIASSVLQVLLPSVLAPRYPGTGLSNVGPRLAWYRDILAEQLGVLAPDSDVISLIGSHRFGMSVLAIMVTLAIIGLVIRCITHPVTDLPIAAFGLAHTAIVLMAPFQEGRYLFPIVPVLTYFAVQSLPAIAELVSVPRPGPVSTTVRLVAAVPMLLIALLAYSSGRDTLWWADVADGYRRADQVMNGPERPEAQEMVQAVLDITAPDDVVAFFRARAMTMLTDRRSLQAGNIEPILAGADWYVMERGSTYSQPLLNADMATSLGLREVWSNNGWVLFRLPGGPHRGR